jgi:hypothetical protein
MPMKFCFVFSAILFLFYSAIGQTGNRDQYLTFQDTLELVFIAERPFIKHIMSPGQTLYGLSRFYGLEPDEIIFYNQQYKETLPLALDTLMVPVPKKSLLPYYYQDYARWKGAPLVYRAQKGETQYQISQRRLGIHIDSLKAYNNLKDDNLTPGQTLFIGWLSTKGIPDSVRQFTGHPLWSISHNYRSQYIKARKEAKELEQQGYGNKIITGSTRDELVVLHNEAPLNSIVALKNPLNNRVVFAKVIGPIPPGTYPVGTVVVTSSTITRMLAVLDNRFFVRLKYLN